MPSRITDLMVLRLFTMGVTKGKWGALINSLLAFKRDHGVNAPLGRVLRDLVAAAPDRYGAMGLRDLADDMFAAMRAMRLDALQAEAFGRLPQIATTPRAAFQRLRAGERSRRKPARNAVGSTPRPVSGPRVAPADDARA